jgi:hypothetical protein
MTADRLLAFVQEVFDLGQLAVDALERRRLLDENVHLHVVANRHLIEQAAEFRLHQREALSQALTLGEELWAGRRSCRGRHSGGGSAGGRWASQELHGTTTVPGRLFCWLT